MKILVTDANYVGTDKVFSVFFVRGRNIYYKRSGIEVSVLNFSAKKDTILDGIPIYSLKTYEEKLSNEKFDILVCHAPNIRNHYKFLKKYHKRFPKVVFFFHGHEVLHCSKVYPKPYSYVKEASWYKKVFREFYDIIKLKLWGNYFTKLAPKSHFIFVSKWMYDEFLKWTKVDSKILENRMSITYNSVGSSFEEQQYKKSHINKYDFITIRGNLDGSKYCIDKVTDLAIQYPQYKFCIVGKGLFFQHNNLPENVTWIDRHLNHKEIVEFLSVSSCALMPTLTDAQGLMACEMATYGIPVITSDIPVCHEIFDDFKNVAFISNDNYNFSLPHIYEKLTINLPYSKNKKYFAKNTCKEEIKIFESLTNTNINNK